VTTILGLSAALVLAQWLLGRRARRDAARLLKPADEWDDEDVARWLARIEPFPLPESTTETQRHRGEED
jgi:hypothetical protein